MILVAGESLVDMLPSDSAGHTVFRPVPGGSPYNVSVALGRLGMRVRFLGCFSHDPFGTLLKQTLEQSGVETSHCPRTNNLTTLGFVIVNRSSGNPSYSFYTDKTAGCCLELADLPVTLPGSVNCLHFGSFSIAAEPIGSALEGLLKFKTPTRLISLDPNIRPFLIPDRKHFELRLNRFAAVADLIKMSEEDLKWLHPGLPARACGEKYLASGASLVVVTRGEKGAVAMNARGSSEVMAEPIIVADTVGAGDTFHAAMLAWLSHRNKLNATALQNLSTDDLQNLLRYASTAAAINCSRCGCNPPWEHELKEEQCRQLERNVEATPQVRMSRDP